QIRPRRGIDKERVVHVFSHSSIDCHLKMSFFRGKVVIITGSSNGIGRGTAELFAKTGAKLTITGRNKDTLEETYDLCLRAGMYPGGILKLIGDVTDEAFVEQLVEKTVEKFGQLDVLVNNAGASVFDLTGKKGLEVPLANYDRIMDINVRSVVKISQLAVPHLEKTKGAIVNVSSIAGYPFSAQEAYYSMSKAALDQLTVQMAGQLINKGIRVNSVNPGAIQTNFAVTAGAPAELLQEMYSKVFGEGSEGCKKVIPLGKIGQPDDIGKIILFLADRTQSEIIVGQRIVADGGSLIKNNLLSMEM
ncbi:dhs-14, partial [Pristionchus pacificus]